MVLVKVLVLIFQELPQLKALTPLNFANPDRE